MNLLILEKNILEGKYEYSYSYLSSESDEEQVQCLMTDGELETAEDEMDIFCDIVFDFSSNKFTRKDIVTTLHEMLDELKVLSQSFEEVRRKRKA